MGTERLELIPATVEICEAERVGPRLSAWRCACAFPIVAASRARARRCGASPAAARDRPECSQLDLALPRASRSRRRRPARSRRVAGYAGPPSAEGAVEIGYAIAEEYQRRGYATEAVKALIERAFTEPSVVVVTATTYASLAPSIGVLTKTGFTQVSSDPDTGLLKYECRRDRAS